MNQISTSALLFQLESSRLAGEFENAAAVQKELEARGEGRKLAKGRKLLASQGYSDETKDAVKKELLEYQRQYGILKRMFADTRQSYDFLDKRYTKVFNALYALYNWQNGCPIPGKEKEWRDAMKITRKVLGIPEDD